MIRNLNVSKSELNKLLNDIILRKKKLSFSEAYSLMTYLLHLNEPYIVPTWTAVFASIQTRGVEEEEIVGFLEAFKDFTNFEINNLKKPKILDKEKIISLVGSGKDDIKTINVSTLSSIVLASLRKIRVVKHGSYGGSSVYGNRNILEAFGISTKNLKDLRLDVLEKEFIYFLPIEEFIKEFDRKYGGNFLFFHPLSYVLAGVLNPYYLDWLVMGITDFNRTMLSAKILKKYNYKGIVISGEIKGYGYIDELSPFGFSKICYFENDIYEELLDPAEIFGKRLKPIGYIFQTANLEYEKRKFEEIIRGNAPFEAKALIALNAGAPLSLITQQSLADSVKECLEIIDSGEPYNIWKRLKEMLYEK